MGSKRRVLWSRLVGVAALALVLGSPPPVLAQAPIEDALVPQTPVSKFITEVREPEPPPYGASRS
jgi:hypothetical protein